ncbi:NgoBV family restriction endonuclease [Aliarcobacter butzleri]|uniref:NgoBV family restriction endonuclease n=1 Tax=Aliarcobacter butzleri TaxID=28197 RepID=UPI002B25048C|nr:NgoBV family restriction endonuclease [Aliarcobacter butzleri]
MPTFMTASQLYNALLQSGIINSQGNVTFTLNNISILIETKDSIGHMIQDWLKAWANSNNIYLEANHLTQEFPDFYLTQNHTDNFLEVKSFDSNAGPNFDVSNFDTYVRSLLVNPKKVDADYLIFGYTLINGVLTITGVWLKKIWELCTSSADWALRLQVKQGVIHNIRPVNFTSTRTTFGAFQNRLQFLTAIQDVLNTYRNTQTTHQNWLIDFSIAYRTATGVNP